MKKNNDGSKMPVSDVNRTKGEARSFYDTISRYYDWVGGSFERKFTNRALDCLNIRSGESVLEIGFGTGYSLRRIAEASGSSGRTCGLDISAGMIRRAGERLKRESWLNRVHLCQGDAAWLPFEDNVFDAVFLSFTLELFSNTEIPQVLGEIMRVLKPGGRLGIVSLSKAGGRSLAVGLYERAHRQWPKGVDCRPIYAADEIKKAGYKITRESPGRLVVLPVEIVIAEKAG
jgi:ubiquinone/menaquinone biosynthesis C-methylase UbiE